MIILDTNVLFGFMANHGDIAGKVEIILSESNAAISTITVYELFRGVSNNKHLDSRKKLVSLCEILDISKPVSLKAADIYTHLKSKGKLIANQDILIAATALYWKYPLLTNNNKDFQRIRGINFA